VQTCTVRVPEDVLAATSGAVSVFHEMHCPPKSAAEPPPATARFTAGTVLADLGGESAESSVHVFSGVDPVTETAAASVYMWEDEHAEHFEHRGFNVHTAAPGTAFNRIDLRGGVPVADMNREFRFHIVSCVMSRGADGCACAERDTQRTLLGILGRGRTSRPGNGGGRPHAYLRA